MIELFGLYLDKKNNTLFIPYYISNYIECIGVNVYGNTWQSSFDEDRLFKAYSHLESSPLLTDLAHQHILEDLREFVEKKRITVNKQSKINLIKFIL